MREYAPEELPDPRNAAIVVHVAGRLVPRADAKVSVFDSSVQGGDAVWEGLRVYDGRVFAVDRHLDRLFDSARALRFEGTPTREAVWAAIVETLAANGMRDGVHIRLTLTRGPKVTSGMTPRNNRAGCCLIVLAEWKPPVGEQSGVRLITASLRRNSPATLDSKVHHANLLNNILAKIEADVAGADDALMLDVHGFVAETNAANVFVVRRGRLCTPHADACLPGITRGIVLELARDDGIPVEERNVSLTEVYTADEMFMTGTMGELTPVVDVDGRGIGDAIAGRVTGCGNCSVPPQRTKGDSCRLDARVHHGAGIALCIGTGGGKGRVRIEVTTGTGDGPTPVAAFGAALRDAGVAQYSLLEMSAVIPAGSAVRRHKHVTPDGEYGDRLYVVLARQHAEKAGTMAWAGLGWTQEPATGRGLFVALHGRQEGDVESDIRATLASMLVGRPLAYGPIEMELAGVGCAGRPVCALVLAVFGSESWDGA